MIQMINDRNKKKEAKRGDVVKNDKQAMKILGLLENTDKKEVLEIRIWSHALNL